MPERWISSGNLFRILCTAIKPAVTGRELFIEVIPVDFNRDKVVDAADYTFWRENFVQPPPTATTAVSAIVIAPPLARDLALTPRKSAAPITTSSPRRTDLLLTARDSAFADLGRDEIPSSVTTHKPAARKFAPAQTAVKPKL